MEGKAKKLKVMYRKTLRGMDCYMSPLLYNGLHDNKEDVQHNPFKSDVFSLGYCFICASALDPEVINEIRQIKDQNKIKLKEFIAISSIAPNELKINKELINTAIRNIFESWLTSSS